jgi:hypothetical protein
LNPAEKNRLLYTIKITVNNDRTHGA